MKKSKMKKFIKIFILFIVYPIFFWIDRKIIPLNNIFWHSYAQDLVMPGLLFLCFAINAEIFFEYLSTKIALIVGGVEFLSGVHYEYGQLVGTTPGTADKWDVLCYAVSIIIATIIFLLIRRERDYCVEFG